MAINSIKKLSLFIHNDVADDVSIFLQRKGVLELKSEDLKESLGSHDFSIGSYSEVGVELSSYLSKLDKAIKVLQTYEDTKGLAKFFPVKLLINEHQIINNKENIKALCLYINRELNNLEEINTEIVQTECLLADIDPWLSIEVRLDELFGTRFSRTLGGMLPNLKFNEFAQSFKDKQVVILPVKHTKKEVYFVAISFYTLIDDLREFVSRNGKLVHWEAFENTPGQILNYLNKKNRILNKKVLRIKNKIKNRLPFLNALKIEHDRIYNAWLLESKKTDILFSKRITLVIGWIQEKDIKSLKLTLEHKFPETEIVINDPQEGDQVPVAFENSKYMEPFELITDLYGRPQYSGIDPTPYLGIFFVVFFGVCLADAGYGLMMIAMAVLFIKILKNNVQIKKTLRLFLFMGISSLVMGTITGTFFGNLLTFLPPSLSFIKASLDHLVLLNPLDERGSLIFLAVSLLFGYIQICFGIVLNILEKLKQKDYEVLFLSAIPIFSIQLALLPITLFYVLGIKIFSPALMNVFVFMLFAGMALIAIHEWRRNEGIFIKIFWCIYGNYALITGNFLSDTLSYARLFALGLSGGLLGLAINEIASIFKDIPVVGIFLMIIVMIVGHLFNLGISFMGGFVHSCRLQYLEFFTKFFESGGRKFEPFKMEGKYTVLEENLLKGEL